MVFVFMKSNIDQCIKCSICNAYCPVFAATGLFPGPKVSGPDTERFRRGDGQIPAKWLQFCDYCKICERVCPHKVAVPDIQMQARKRGGRKKPPLRDRMLGQSYLLEKMGSWGDPVSNWVFQWSFLRWLLDRGLGIDRRMALPSFRRRTFRKWHEGRDSLAPIKPSPKTPSTKGGRGLNSRAAAAERVAYFYGCYTNYVDPDLGKAVVSVLERNGVQVFLPEQQCCGLPLMGNCLFDLAGRLGEKNIASLTGAVGEGMEIIYSSPSCGMMIQKEYENVLGLTGASAVAPHLWEISQFLLRMDEEGKLDGNFNRIDETYYYHAPCHLRALQIGLPGLELLSLIPGLRIIELPEGCCGLAGSYGFKKEKYEIADRIGKEIFQAVRRSKARVVVSECEACRMQIAQKTGVETLHPIQVLNKAYGGPGSH